MAQRRPIWLKLKSWPGALLLVSALALATALVLLASAPHLHS